ncbi:hypothetical protein D3C77_624570 [compost metagenome]
MSSKLRTPALLGATVVTVSSSNTNVMPPARMSFAAPLSSANSGAVLPCCAAIVPSDNTGAAAGTRKERAGIVSKTPGRSGRWSAFCTIVNSAAPEAGRGQPGRTVAWIVLAVWFSTKGTWAAIVSTCPPSMS